MQDRRLRILTVTVIGKSGAKSIKVAADFKVRHPKYGKYMKRRTKLIVHDEHNQANVGDVVDVCQCRPYSKTKSHRLVRVLKKAVREEV
ncbi:MAG TPA: 30S ribosomal protein S17 [Sedimentisphaerales bacterium]|nr:30S ribosomal protein S17 [Sedimentisphaerales bacterium]